MEKYLLSETKKKNKINYGSGKKNTEKFFSVFQKYQKIRNFLEFFFP